MNRGPTGERIIFIALCKGTTSGFWQAECHEDETDKVDHDKHKESVSIGTSIDVRPKDVDYITNDGQLQIRQTCVR